MIAGEQSLWRKDGVQTPAAHGTALVLYDMAGIGFERWDTIKDEAMAGLVLRAPFASHPRDTFNLQVHWSDLGSQENSFLAEHGDPASDAKFVFDAPAHMFVLTAVAIEPSVQHIVDPDTLCAPTAHCARDGVEVGLTLLLHFNPLLGIATPKATP